MQSVNEFKKIDALTALKKMLQHTVLDRPGAFRTLSSNAELKQKAGTRHRC